MDDRAILLRFNEIALKGANRGRFEELLANNVRVALERQTGRALSVSRRHSRIIVKAEITDPIRQALSQVYGISSFSPMRAVGTDKAAIIRAAKEEFDSYLSRNPKPRSFRIETRRSEKALVETSPELDREIGSAVLAPHPGIQVDLRKPEVTLAVQIQAEQTYLSLEKIAGLKGLPVGANGSLLTLLSGGIDSPIAALQILKRGSPTSFLHFHGAPFVGPEVLEKVEDLARIVNRFQPLTRPLYVVPFGKIQEKIALVTNPKLRTILYRRMMMRIASAAATKIGSLALVTGESLGQVASQTLENLSTIDQAATVPVLRPLITWDKDEIIEAAHRFDTFNVSIRPGVDCCTLFSDRSSSTRASIGLIEEQESRFPIEEYVAEALNATETRLPG